MFNDRYYLTKAVLEGRKTQTRRVINLTDMDKEYLDTAFDWDLRESVIIDRYAKYKVGEVVAVAQSYKNANVTSITVTLNGVTETFYFQDWMPGWNNKMFVKAELMPHHIKITNIRVERLQDISDEDCLAEGVCVLDGKWYFVNGVKAKHLTLRHKNIDGAWQTFKWQVYETLRYAYAALINKVSGKGTWESNPWVFAYDLEKVD